jgi:hypothetical protein
VVRRGGGEEGEGEKIEEDSSKVVRKKRKKDKKEQRYEEKLSTCTEVTQTYERTSNSVPLPVLIVVGEKAFHIILSQILVAMKSEIPEPSP